ncbi:MAG TPA: divergent polysaccharide deacetylase family protein [Bacillota bacterium]|nr:divergent polysaccharide deacetylase family protein [Bacillota bacterium]
MGSVFGMNLFFSVGRVTASELTDPGHDTMVKQATARVAIIIDDIGTSTGYMDEILRIQEPLTWAILPLTPKCLIYAAEGQRRGLDILLHQPLEPLQPQGAPDPGLIYRFFTDEQIIQQLEINLGSVPGLKGINNHMGSAGTADRRLMNVIMGELKKRNLFFIDSYTISNSVADQCARDYQVPFGRRTIFIDERSDFQSKIKALEFLLKYALEHGSAIGIGHARRGTGEAIAAMLPKFKEANVEIVPVSALTKCLR